MIGLIFVSGCIVGLITGVIAYRTLVFHIVTCKKNSSPKYIHKMIGGELLPLVGYLPKDRESFIRACKIIRSAFPVLTNNKPEAVVINGNHETMKIDKDTIKFSR